MQEEKNLLDKTADLMEELSADLGNLAGMACFFRLELEDTDSVQRIHRQTMATIQSALEHLERDAEFIADSPAEFRVGQTLRTADAVFEVNGAELPPDFLPQVRQGQKQREAVRAAAEGSVEGADAGRNGVTGEKGAWHGLTARIGG